MYGQCIKMFHSTFQEKETIHKFHGRNITHQKIATQRRRKRNDCKNTFQALKHSVTPFTPAKHVKSNQI